MPIGVIKEVKKNEHRVAMNTGAVREAVHRGHTVNIQQGAGLGAAITDADFIAAGGTILPSAEVVLRESDLIVHVKEPQAAEIEMLGPEHTLFTYLHLAAYPAVATGLMESGCTAIAYETVETADGHLPLLAPMSTIAGRMAVQAGAHHLEKAQGGRGVLMAGYPGVPGALVVVVGAGSVGTAAAEVAHGMGARVVVLDINPNRLGDLERRLPGLVTVHSNREAIETWVHQADLVVGAVLVAGDKAPTIITEDDIRAMRPGSVVADVAIDQGGCIETAHETTHSDPTYLVHDVVHYAVGNIPGAVPATSTHALSNATSRYVNELAGGLGTAIGRMPELVGGIEIVNGKLTSSVVGDALGIESYDPLAALGL